MVLVALQTLGESSRVTNARQPYPSVPGIPGDSRTHRTRTAQTRDNRTHQTRSCRVGDRRIDNIRTTAPMGTAHARL